MPVVAVDSHAGPIQDKDKKAQDAYAHSIQILKDVIAILEGNTLNEQQIQYMNQYFVLGENNTEIPSKLTTTLKDTKKGLKNNNITIHVYHFSFAKSTETQKLSLALAQFNNSNQVIRYLIHEATHMYAQTNDYSDRGYVNNDGKFRQSGLTQEEAIKNADSYACFVVRCANIPLM